MHLAETADADVFAQVDVACNGGGAGIEPVRGGGLLGGVFGEVGEGGREGRTSRWIVGGVLSRGTF